MKLLNRIVLCTSLFVTGYLSANEMCESPDGGCYQTSAGSNFFDNLSFKAEGLYFQAREDGLEYATSFDFAETEITSGNDNRAFKFKDHSPRFSNRVGYRVGVDFANPCTCWNLAVNYLNFRTSAHGSTSEKSTNTSTPVGLAANADNSGATHLQAKQTSSFSSGVVGLFNSLASSAVLDYAHASLKIRLDIVDIDINREFCLNDCVSINPYVGFRYLNLRQKYRIKGKGFFQVSTTSVTHSEDRLRFKNDFDGWGIHAGLKSDWQVGCGFSIYGLFGGSLLCGSSRTDEREAFKSSNNSENVFLTSVEKGKSHHKGARATAEAGLGLLYDYCFCQNQTVRLKLGWEYLYLFNANRFSTTTILPTIGFGRKNTRSGDLNLQGLVFGFDYSF